MRVPDGYKVFINMKTGELIARRKWFDAYCYFRADGKGYATIFSVKKYSGRRKPLRF